MRLTILFKIMSVLLAFGFSMQAFGNSGCDELTLAAFLQKPLASYPIFCDIEEIPHINHIRSMEKELESRLDSEIHDSIIIEAKFLRVWRDACHTTKIGAVIDVLTSVKEQIASHCKNLDFKILSQKRTAIGCQGPALELTFICE